MARLTKEELLKKIDNEELKKKLSELTEEDLRKVSGGTVDADGNPIKDIVCPDCGKTNTMAALYYGYCYDCDKGFPIIDQLV